MNEIFYLVMMILDSIANITGLTYVEINIIVYYIIAPLVFIALIDRLLHFHYIKVLFALLVIVGFIFIPDLHVFSKWLFIESQHFLKSFSLIGLNYVQASVIICVLVPLLLMLALIYANWKQKIEIFVDSYFRW